MVACLGDPFCGVGVGVVETVVGGAFDSEAASRQAGGAEMGSASDVNRSDEVVEAAYAAVRP